MISVFLVEDHAVVREGLRQFLDRTSDIRIAGEAPNAEAAYSKLAGGDWDLVMLDIALPGESGIQAIDKIKATKPNLPILIFSGFTEDEYALDCLKRGAAGYLAKDCAPDAIRDAIRQVAGGEKYVSQALAKQLLQVVTAPPPPQRHTTLTGRELDIMLRISRGQPLTSIGNDLNLSVKTISSHRTNILEKMAMESNAELTRYVIATGLDRDFSAAAPIAKRVAP